MHFPVFIYDFVIPVGPYKDSPASERYLCASFSFPRAEYISIILDQEKAPGGYIWYFPKNESSVNIGLGTFPEFKGKIKDYYRKFYF